MVGVSDVAKLLSNYAFYGLIMIVVVMRFPGIAWQAAITLTFCHTVIDLMDGFYPEPTNDSPFFTGLAIVLITTLGVSLLTSWIRSQKNSLHKLFLLLIWSTVLIAYLRLAIKPERLNISGLSLVEIVYDRFFVDIIFTLSAIYLSFLSSKIMRKD